MNATTLREMLTRSAGAHANALVDPLLNALEAAERCIDGAGDDLRHANASVRTAHLKALDESVSALYRRAGEVIS